MFESPRGSNPSSPANVPSNYHTHEMNIIYIYIYIYIWVKYGSITWVWIITYINTVAMLYRYTWDTHMIYMSKVWMNHLSLNYYIYKYSGDAIKIHIPWQVPVKRAKIYFVQPSWRCWLSTIWQIEWEQRLPRNTKMMPVMRNI